MQLHPDVRCAIRSEVNILISGACAETRRSAARLIHEWTNPRGAPFLVVGSSANGRPQLRRVRDLVKRSERSTVFIEEVAELDPSTQKGLLQLVRGKADAAVRIIASTGIDLFQRVKVASFRADLFYRLNTIHLELEARPMLVHG